MKTLRCRLGWHKLVLEAEPGGWACLFCLRCHSGCCVEKVSRLELRGTIRPEPKNYTNGTEKRVDAPGIP